MKRTILVFTAMLALLLVVSLVSHAGQTRVFVRGSVWIGPPPFWGPAHWAWCGPRYYYGGPVYYAPPPVIIYRPPVYLQPQHVYVQRGQAESDYWYYCDNPQGFYPYIKSCPGGWMKVVPETVPPNR